VKRNRTTVEKYAVAAALVGAAFALRFGLFGTLDHRLPFSFFIPATIIAAWYGGLGPGLLAAVAGLLLGDYFFLPPHQAEGPFGEAERTAIGMYAMTTTLIVVLFAQLHARLRDLEHKLDNRPGASTEPRQPAAPGMSAPPRANIPS
jgi:K+-sensing histidine kinase KdpD